MSIETTIIVTAIALWFAQGWYVNSRLERVHAKMDLVLDCFDGIREYLYEIDPQFDEERRLFAELDEAVRTGQLGGFAGMNHMELVRGKQARGERTLSTPFHSLGVR
jgi:hypothetical protein